MTPLLSPKPFAAFTPSEFKAYVSSLYIEPPKPAPPAEFSVRTNAKGNPVLTVRREPKWLTSEEVASAAEQLGWSLQKMWLHVLKKKIAICIPDLKRRK
jgi:hypothetical protein